MRLESYVLLEREWAEFNGLHPDGMVVCSSGTAALHMALECLGLRLGGEIIIPDYTMVACPRAATLANLVPVLIDCNAQLLMDFDAFRLYRNSTADALMAVHVYGRRFDHGLIESADDFHHLVVEDLAEAHGVRPHPNSTAACWSFYKNKIIAGEEGGAVYFTDRDAARWARRLRTLGFTEAHDYTHLPRGHNYRMANCLAELVRQSIRDYPKNLYERRLLESYYDKYCPQEWRMPYRDAPWVYDVWVKGMTAERQVKVVRAIQTEGVAARFGFKPMSGQEEFRNCKLFTATVGRAVSQEVETEVFSLPLAPAGLPPDVLESKARRAFGIIQKELG